MALTLRGVAENSALNGGDVVVTLPGGTAENDIVIFAYSIGQNSDIAMSVSTAGYTQIADLYADDSNDSNLGVFWKRMGASPDTTVTGVGDGTASSAVAGVCQVWTGVDTVTALDATTTTATGINDAVPDSPSITTVTANAVVISIGCGSVVPGDTSVTAPSGYSNQVDIKSDDTRSTTLGMASKLVASPGAEDPAAWTTWSVSGSSADSMCAATVALRPAADAGHPAGKRMGGVKFANLLGNTTTRMW